MRKDLTLVCLDNKESRYEYMERKIGLSDEETRPHSCGHDSTNRHECTCRQKWMDGSTTNPKYDDVVRAARALDIDPNWLMYGNGAMDIVPADQIELDMIDIKASCGSVGHINFEDIPAIKKILVNAAWFRQHFGFYNSKTIKIVAASGDSMTPEIDDGDVVFVDISDNISFRDGIYLILVDDEVFIKRIQRLVGHKIALVSANKAYRDIEINTDGQVQIHVLGRVVKSFKMRNH